jgi:hypothetical protein
MIAEKEAAESAGFREEIVQLSGGFRVYLLKVGSSPACLDLAAGALEEKPLQLIDAQTRGGARHVQTGRVLV